ncbi:MAG: transporter substrate-binding domain-containing protein [Pseudooceanicola sp.]
MTRGKIGLWGLFFVWLMAAVPAVAQDQTGDGLVIATVTRPPFSFQIEDQDTGFAIDLWDKIAAEIGVVYDIRRLDSFSAMMDAVQAGAVDGAVANISITSAREGVMDFTLPVFDGGIQIMLPDDPQGSEVWRTILNPKVWLTLIGAVALMIGAGMLMWVFERRKQHYFGKTSKEAVFPAFWWSLNLLVAGSFEENMPVSRAGRLLSVVMVVSSLFLVTMIVANVTAQVTVNAIAENVGSIADLRQRRAGATGGSTASLLLAENGVDHSTFDDLEALLTAFEAGEIDAVVFDGPVLAYYAQTRGRDKARVLPKVFRAENYGMALPEGSDLREPINRALLRLREDGTYRQLLVKWFGAAYAG